MLASRVLMTAGTPGHMYLVERHEKCLWVVCKRSVFVFSLFFCNIVCFCLFIVRVSVFIFQLVDFSVLNHIFLYQKQFSV